MKRPGDPVVPKIIMSSLCYCAGEAANYVLRIGNGHSGSHLFPSELEDGRYQAYHNTSPRSMSTDTVLTGSHSANTSQQQRQNGLNDSHHSIPCECHISVSPGSGNKVTGRCRLPRRTYKDEGDVLRLVPPRRPPPELEGCPEEFQPSVPQLPAPRLPDVFYLTT